MGQSPPGETYNYDGVGLPFFQGKADFGDVHPTPTKWCSKPTRIANPGDVLLSVRAPVGPTNTALATCCIGRGLAAIRPTSALVYSSYLRHFFRHYEVQLSLQGHGSTFSAIKRTDVTCIQLPLPPLPVQRHIVDILDQVDNVRRLQATATAKADRILPALFMQMFGDPATNPMRWRIVPLGDALVDTQYGLSKRATTDYTATPILRMNNISPAGEILLDDLKFVDIDPTETKKFLLHPGDLLFNRTNSIDLVGKTGLWTNPDLPVVAASYLIRVRVDREQLVPSYLWALMQTPYMKALLRRKARRAVGMANVNASELRQLPGMLPPLQLQNEFATLSTAVRQDRTLRAHYTGIASQLVRGLLYNAFSDVPRRPLATCPPPNCAL